MPTHRGIKVSVVSQLELKLHPEFPHPESSQFTYRSPDVRKGTAAYADWTPPSASSDSKADRLLGRQSVVSVYIPSMPATRFWMRYNVAEAAMHSEWFYFKLFMNGRHITSWGTDAKTKPSGQVMRGLFEPSDRWNYRYEGTLFRNMGTEARPFIFGYEEKEPSAAKDGGLIEVMVFRARGRKRKLPALADFKNQEGYGIIMPSGGLLEKPQEAKFYDWHLKDPKDSPFVTFKFHYRSWDNLINLQLIPDNHPRTLLPASPSVLSLNGASQDLHTKLEEDTDEEEKQIIEQLKRSMSSIISNDPWLTSVFDDSPERPPSKQGSRSSFNVPPEITPLFSSRRLPEVPTSRFSAAVIDKPASPQNNWNGYLDRPLPEIPTRDSSLKRQRHDPDSRSRSSSGISHSPSIAASLLPYVERDTASPEPVLGVAKFAKVEVTTSPMMPSPSPSALPSSPSLDDTNLPEPNPAKSKRQGIASPPLNSLFSMANITVRKTRRSAKRLSDYYSHSPSYSPCPPSCRTPIQDIEDQTQNFTDENENDIYNDRTTLDTSQNTLSMTISESEWMCRTPSPVKSIPRFGSVQKLWSPGLEKRASRDTSMGSSMSVLKEKQNAYGNEQENQHEHHQHGNSKNGRSASGKKTNKYKRAPTPAHWYSRAKNSAVDGHISEHAFGSDNARVDRPLSGNWI
ncbi:hypothetical protein ONS95_006605 [Cadophora gregata]|uniref:uncharacterized protein n=1 Tax=Cadophora gregata TaxID=51156 RepID=UPI0026DC348B|nr:uncharacterized protein ONS95_006605 [Cadophora gregata]KAK0101432.1 hypothetical protein ONS95_006605 [Cadophora gregata]KAK0106557.1 hypothetical protein ONS96_004178 [Cadophora gregata f. sp. sojae]